MWIVNRNVGEEGGCAREERIIDREALFSTNLETLLIDKHFYQMVGINCRINVLFSQ